MLSGAIGAQGASFQTYSIQTDTHMYSQTCGLTDKAISKGSFAQWNENMKFLVLVCIRYIITFHLTICLLYTYMYRCENCTCRLRWGTDPEIWARSLQTLAFILGSQSYPLRYRQYRHSNRKIHEINAINYKTSEGSRVKYFDNFLGLVIYRWAIFELIRFNN